MNRKVSESSLGISDVQSMVSQQGQEAHGLFRASSGGKLEGRKFPAGPSIQAVVNYRAGAFYLLFNFLDP